MNERAMVGFWLAGAILVGVGVVAYTTSQEAVETIARVEHTRDVIAHLDSERGALSEATAVRRGYALDGDLGWLADYQSAIAALMASQNAIRALTIENLTQQRRLDELEPLLKAEVLRLDAAIERTKRNTNTPDLERQEMRAARVMRAQIDPIISSMADEELRLLALRRHDTVAYVRSMRIGQLGGIVVAFAFLLVAFRRLRRETRLRFSSEQAAKKGERDLARILMSIGDGVIATDSEGRVVRMNHATEQLTGWTSNTGMGKPASEIFHVIDAETRAPIPDPIARVLNERADVGFERPWLLTRKDGSELPVADSCAAVRDETGAVQGAVLVFRDVSKEERAKTLFRALVEKSSDGFALTAPDGTLTYASPAAARILGRTPEAVIGTNLLDYTSPGDGARAHAVHRDVIETSGASVATESKVSRPDGTSSWIELTSTNLVDNPAVGAIVRNMRDLTESKLAESALRTSEAQFERLSASGLIGVTRTNMLGNVYDANDEYLRMMGYSRSDVQAERINWLSMTPPEWAATDECANEQLKRTGVATPWEKELIRKDGSRVRVLIGAAMLDQVDCIAFLVDLTERERSAKTLRETEEQLRQAQKMDAVGRLAGGVAHDFNNLLSVILSYSEFLLADVKPNDPMHADLDEIRKAGERAAALTRQLLMFSRQQVIEPTIVNLNDVLSNMEKMLKRLLGEDIDVAFTQGSTAMVLVDPSGIEQVVMNLVVNARDAMPTGGKLTIETADIILDDEYARHHVGVNPGPHVMLAVTDGGIGMDAATKERIFEPFFTTKEKGKGTGLGLSTVFGIATQNGGSVWVYSELGIGTTFKVYLPRASSAPRARSMTDPRPTSRGTETILLVEDEEQVRIVARGILTRAGYKVHDVRTAGEALLHCEQTSGAIHLLLTDVVMPQMSGPELAKRLAVKRPEMRVLCMSGYTDDSIVRHGVLAARFAFLQKPLTPDAVTRKVREVLDAPSNVTEPDQSPAQAA